MNIKRILKEEILKEYAQKVVQELIYKFKQERPDINDEQFTSYINRFEVSKASPKIVEKDIKKYTFAELEKVIDSLPSKEKVNKDINTAQVEAEIIYKGNGIEVYLGDERHKCVKYRKAFQGDTQQANSWCVAAEGSGNLFTGYRYGGYGVTRIFYFVIDRKLPVTNQNHVFVVHAFEDNTYGFTNALNDGDKEDLDWNELVKHAPTLRQVPQNIFKPKPLTEDEKEVHALTSHMVKEDDIVAYYFSLKTKYNPVELTKAYLEIHGHTLEDVQMETLLKNRQVEILNLYISIGKDIPTKILKQLPPSSMKNYGRMTQNLLDNGNVHISFLRNLQCLEFNIIDEESVRQRDPDAWYTHQINLKNGTEYTYGDLVYSKGQLIFVKVGMFNLTVKP